MANGFFLGGAAEGMADAEKQRLARETLATETGLRERGLGIQERGASVQERAQALSEKNSARVAGQQGLERVDKQIAETMATVSETVKQGLAAGRDPATIQKAIAPLVDSAKRLAPYAKRDPAAIDAQVGALLTGPTQAEAVGATLATETARAQGKETGEGLGKAAAAKALAAAGVVDPNAGFKDKGQMVTAEGSLRDDYVKQSQSFITVRDAKNRLDNLEKTGAGDMTLVFQFMKMLDPGSTVREGEYASAANSAGVPSSVQALYNKAIGEGSIGTKARKEILGQANKIFESAAVQHDKATTTFANISKRLGLNPDNVVIDLSPTGPVKKPVASGDIPAPPPGFVVSK